MESEQPKRPGLDRRSFIKTSAGVATGAAVVATPAALALGGGQDQPRTVVPHPASPMPQEPVTAYVRNAERGEVTVLSGTGETTYKDPALVRQLLDASKTTTPGGPDVIAP